MFNWEYLSSFTCIITVVFVPRVHAQAIFFPKPLLGLCSQNAPVKMLWTTCLHSQLQKQSEMQNAPFLPLLFEKKIFLLLWAQVAVVSVIRRFHFPPSHSDSQLWCSRKCHWWRSSSPSPGPARSRNRCTGSAGEEGWGTSSLCPRGVHRLVW